MAVAVNTGDDRCRSAVRTDVCNRYGAYPELTSIRFGAPLTRAPVRQGCVGRSEVRCVWSRHYAGGVDVLNATGARRGKVRVDLGTRGCRRVVDVSTGQPLARGRCVKRVVIGMPRWSGRPLVYRR
jgi:hypothetical protein